MPINDTVGTYATNMAVGYPGMIAESQMIKDVASKVVATANVAFGLAVGADGTVPNSVKLGGTGFIGIAVADKSREADLYEVGEMGGFLRKGTIWVTASTAVVVSDPVTFTAATGVIGAGLATTIAGAKFETAGSIGDLVRVYLG
jgi:hypothetical protein